MARIARTKGVSMMPDQEVRWNRLQAGRRTSDFVRYLLDLAERDVRERREREGQEALARIIQTQSDLPPEWKDDRYYDLDSPNDFGPVPPEFTKSPIDMREVLASWREDVEA